MPASLTRRAILPKLALLGAGGGALWLVRDRLPWPPLKVAFEGGRPRTDWIGLPKQGDLVEVPARIGGEAIRVIVDSGAQFSAIDRGLAERLALPQTVALPILAYGVSGGPSLTYSVSLDVELPQLSVRGIHAATLDLASLGQVTGRDFDMLLGRDVLRQVMLIADFPQGRAAFHDPAAYAPAPAAIAAPLRLVGGAPMLAVSVEGRPALDVLVDTGATGALALSEEAAQAQGLLNADRPQSQIQSVTLGGVGISRLVTARTIAFAGQTLKDAAVQIYAPSLKGALPQGLLGTGALLGFEVALDVGGGRLFLTPGPGRLIRGRRRN